MRRALPRRPLEIIGRPQQACPFANTTRQPQASRTSTAACPTSGDIVSVYVSRKRTTGRPAFGHRPTSKPLAETPGGESGQLPAAGDAEQRAPGAISWHAQRRTRVRDGVQPLPPAGERVDLAKSRERSGTPCSAWYAARNSAFIRAMSTADGHSDLQALHSRHRSSTAMQFGAGQGPGHPGRRRTRPAARWHARASSAPRRAAPDTTGTSHRPLFRHTP